MYKLTFMDGAMPRAHQLKEGDTVIGRAPTCDLVITAPLMSRHHAVVRVDHKQVFLRDAGSTYGTSLKGSRLTTEQEIKPGDSFTLGPITLTLDREVHENEVLSEKHQIFDESATLVKRMENLNLPPAAATVEAAAQAAATLVQPPPTAPVSPAAAPTPPKGTPPTGPVKPVAVSTPVAPATPAPAPPKLVMTPSSERRSGLDRRKADVGRPAGERRSGRDRRGGRLLRLLSEISKTLVAMQPLEKVLNRVVELVFEVVPAERAFLLLRDSIDQPLSARVMRNRDGSVPPKVSISRTIVNTVMRDRVAMLAKDALYDSRLHASDSIQSMNIRSFMCAPLWNQNDVIGVLYCDNPRSKKFITDDLEVFAALCNYAAVAIEQARLSLRLLDESKRRERLTRYHSPGVINRIMQDGDAEGAFMAQERDVSVMFCDIVGFTTMSQHAPPQEIADMLNDFFGRMGEVIFEHDGTLDKFIGDAILAVFGAPFEQPDHATKAVAAALAMQRELIKANAEHPERPLRMRIAINSGRALTGDIGSPKRREFTVLGDVVNTASRLESTVAKPDQIVISKNTLEKIGNAFQVQPLGGVKLRGRDTELEVFEVVG
ncbi:MAG TPA: adenylate/guanylate cyclase domain-containing protein [Vicinamibacterales bacterium]